MYIHVLYYNNYKWVNYKWVNFGEVKIWQKLIFYWSTNFNLTNCYKHVSLSMRIVNENGGFNFKLLPNYQLYDIYMYMYL